MKFLLVLLNLQIIVWNGQAQNTIIFTGTTNTVEEKTIHILNLDEDNTELKLLSSVNGGKGPGYLVISTDGSFLYAVCEEIFQNKGQDRSLNAFRINNKDWKLENLNTVSSHGIHPCHISLSPDGKVLFTANYTSGSVSSFPVNSDGTIADANSVFIHEGSGPDKSRQEGPHAHFIQASPDGRYVYSADLGIDKILIYKLSPDGKMIQNTDAPFLQLKPGSGPRHMAFHSNGKLVFILNELSNEVVSCNYDPLTGNLSVKDIKSTLEKGFNEYSKAAAIRIHPNGKYLYCSNRGENSIAVFRINQNGSLEKIQSFKEGIETVRDFNITPSGKYLIAGNQGKNEIILLQLKNDGQIIPTGKSMQITEPTCIVFYPL